MPPSLLPSTAFVYSGPGAGSRSVLSAVESLRRALKPTLVLVDTLSTDQLLQGEWTKGCRMLVMPGGADLPYCRHLNGNGNRLISNFVKDQGGTYIGLCAGAYYGCSRVEFEVGSEIEVVGDRELAFYPGVARGSIYSGFDYQSEAGARAAPIRFRTSTFNSSDGGSNNGTNGMWEECRDYLNGGPGFLEPPLPLRGTGNGADGGDIFSSKLLTLNSSCLPKNIEILATFTEHNNAAAAIACQIGFGRAVLCSTHPELMPEWLALPPGAGRSDAVLRSVDLENGLVDSTSECTTSTCTNDEGEGHVEMLRKELLEHQQGRWRFWQTLLIAAGLEDALI